MPTTLPIRIACEWTCPRSGRDYILWRRGRHWLIAWYSDDDWSMAMGRSIPEAFRNNSQRRIPTGFPYRGSGCARRRVAQVAARA